MLQEKQRFKTQGSQSFPDFCIEYSFPFRNERKREFCLIVSILLVLPFDSLWNNQIFNSESKRHAFQFCINFRSTCNREDRFEADAETTDFVRFLWFITVANTS